MQNEPVISVMVLICAWFIMIVSKMSIDCPARQLDASVPPPTPSTDRSLVLSIYLSIYKDYFQRYDGEWIKGNVLPSQWYVASLLFETKVCAFEDLWWKWLIVVHGLGDATIYVHITRERKTIASRWRSATLYWTIWWRNWNCRQYIRTLESWNCNVT